MEWFTNTIGSSRLADLEQVLSDWFFVFSLAFLAVELVRYALKKQLSWSVASDTATNFVTQLLFIAVSAVLFFSFYISALSYFHQWALVEIPTNWWTLAACIVIADFAYYWEHRFSHRVALAWATHTVHHSSPYFNMSVAYRFGPMDAFWPIFFHVPIVLLGFSPFAVIFAEAIVLLYQTVLHTEVIGKLPRPIEAVFNTPSHHRVHHGSNDAYIDKNYGGILIVWDRLFGTFAEEREAVVFGITKPLGTANPLVVFFHGLKLLLRDVVKARGLTGILAVLIRPPGAQRG